MMKHALLTLAVLSFSGASVLADDNAKTVDLLGADGKKTGSAIITPAPDGTMMRVDVSGLTPGWHGVHIHAKGDCSDHADHFAASGGHSAEDGQTHGFLTVDGPHDGDMTNVWVHGDGTGKGEFYNDEMKMDDFSDADGSALMIHADADDFTTQPTGNAGGRVACGVIVAPKAAE